MTFRVLVADSLAKEGLQAFSEAENLELVDRRGIDKEELIKILPDYDALVVRSRTKVSSRGARVALSRSTVSPLRLCPRAIC